MFIDDVKKPDFTEEEMHLANKIIDAIAEQGMSYVEAMKFTVKVHKEIEFRLSKAILS